jgi:hypothetical protein
VLVVGRKGVESDLFVRRRKAKIRTAEEMVPRIFG